MENLDYKKAKNCLHGQLFLMSEDELRETGLIWYEENRRKEITYAQLKGEVLKMANMLRMNGVTPGDLIGVMLPRGKEQIIAILGILSVGAVYVPIGYNQPIERVKKIIESGDINYLLTIAQSDVSKIDLSVCVLDFEDYAECELINEVIFPISSETAYVIFTSGTTGIPKGVVISHDNALNTIRDINDRFNMDKDDCFFSISEITFDLSVYDIFGAIQCGARNVLVMEKDKKEAGVWIDIITREKVTVWNSVPALYEMLLIAGADKTVKFPFKKVLLSGDWVRFEIFHKSQELTGKECRLIVLGGATEGSIWSCFYEVEEIKKEWKSIPYGAPLRNQYLEIVNDTDELCQVEEIGELIIGGRGVAKGYLNQQELTKERFFEKAGIPWYRTGDLAKYKKNGEIEFLGRKDYQIKLNGYRIELGEIENVLKNHSSVYDVRVGIFENNYKKSIGAVIIPTFNSKNIEFDCEEQVDVCDMESVDRFYSVARFLLENYFQEWIGNKIKDILDLFSLKNAVLCMLYWAVENKILKIENNLIETGSMYRNIQSMDRDKICLLKELDIYKEIICEILCGEKQKNKLLEIDVLSPEKLTMRSKQVMQFIDDIVIKVKDSGIEKPKIAFIGARGGDAVKEFINGLDEQDAELTLFDESLGMLQDAIEKLNICNQEIKIYNLRDFVVNGVLAGSFDYVIAINCLHRYVKIEEGLQIANVLLKNKGVLYAIEFEKLDPMSIVSSAILENGFIDYKNNRRDKYTPFIGLDEWKEIFRKTYFSNVRICHKVQQGIFCQGVFYIEARQDFCLLSVDALYDYLDSKLPEYMQPKQFLFVPQYPLTNNGKVDVKKILELNQNSILDESETFFTEPYETEVANLLKQLLNIKNIGRENNFFEIGGDSLVATRFVHEIKRLYGFDMKLTDIFGNPTLMEIAQLMREYEKNAGEIEEGEI